MTLYQAFLLPALLFYASLMAETYYASSLLQVCYGVLIKWSEEGKMMVKEREYVKSLEQEFIKSSATTTEE